MKKTRQFSAWHDNQEQWDENNLPEPDFSGRAFSYLEAAELLADQDSTSSCVDIIVRDDEFNGFHKFTLVRDWTVKTSKPVTLLELCSL